MTKYNNTLLSIYIGIITAAKYRLQFLVYVCHRKKSLYFQVETVCRHIVLFHAFKLWIRL